MNEKFYGKYRGIVTNIDDPQKRGRIRARVAAVDDETGWALPCLPFAGKLVGMLALPLLSSAVWIEFENGDLDYPIWSGCFWGDESEVPAPDKQPDNAQSPYQKFIIQTPGGHSLVIDDDPNSGGITLQLKSGQKLVLSPQGVQLLGGSGATDAKIELKGNKVALNGDGLEVI